MLDPPPHLRRARGGPGPPRRRRRGRRTGGRGAPEPGPGDRRRAAAARRPLRAQLRRRMRAASPRSATPSAARGWRSCCAASTACASSPTSRRSSTTGAPSPPPPTASSRRASRRRGAPSWRSPRHRGRTVRRRRRRRRGRCARGRPAPARRRRPALPPPRRAAGGRRLAAAAREAVEAAGLPRRAVRVVTSIWGDGGDLHHFTFRAAKKEWQEDRFVRDIHPMLAERLELWRLSNFEVERLRSADDIYAFRGTARANPRDERLFVIAEVRDLTPQADGDGPMRFPHLERMFHESLAVIRRFQSQRSAETRLHWNRVTLYLWPLLELPGERLRALIRRLAPAVEGARHAKGGGQRSPAGSALRRSAPGGDRAVAAHRPGRHAALPRVGRPADRAAQRVPVEGGAPAPPRPGLSVRADPPAGARRRHRVRPAAWRVRGVRPRRRRPGRAGRPRRRAGTRPTWCSAWCATSPAPTRRG